MNKRVKEMVTVTTSRDGECNSAHQLTPFDCWLVAAQTLPHMAASCITVGRGTRHLPIGWCPLAGPSHGARCQDKIPIGLCRPTHACTDSPCCDKPPIGWHLPPSLAQSVSAARHM